MEKIQLYSGIIDNAVETIAELDATNSVITKSFNSYYESLKETLENLSQVHLNEIEIEIWDCNSQFKNQSETLSYINTFFLNLFGWKYGINSTEDIIESVNSDMGEFPLKYFSNNYSDSQKSAIRKIYVTIAVKLQQFKHQYKDISNRFIDRVRATEDQKKLPYTWSTLINFKLNPDYAAPVANYINAAIDNGWFSIVDPKKQVLKVDILNSFGYYLSCPIPNIAPGQNPLLQTTEVLCNTEPVSEPAAIATNSLAAHLLHTQPALLAEKIKTVFNIEKGKSIRLLIKALEENQPALITVANRNFKAVYLALKETLGRDIGSYQSVMGYKYNSTADQPDYDAICQKLTHILTTLESGTEPDTNT